MPLFNTIMKKISISICVGIASLCLSSCYCDKYAVGNISQNEELVHVASVHNFHFIAGAVVNHNEAKIYVPNVENYVIENKQTFGDLLLSSVTFGIFTPTTTKFYVSKNDPNVVVMNKKFASKSYKGYLKK